jgi:protein ImuB
MSRYVSLFLPSWPTDRLRLEAPPERGPLVLALAGRGGLRVSAVDGEARTAGIRPGMLLADARAVCPGLRGRPGEPEADRRALVTLALWCGRYTPFAAPDGDDGVVLDITGCAHLFGGERGMLRDLLARMARRGIEARAAAADSPAAAWAWARYSEGGVLPPGRAREALAPLPLAALRLPAEILDGLGAMGVRRVGELTGLPSGPLLRRFGREPLLRLDQAFGRTAEPIAPLRPRAPLAVRLTFADGLTSPGEIEAAVGDLVGDLVRRLGREGLGARRVVLELLCLDGRHARIAVATARPTRHADHLARLLVERLEGLDVGFGVEAMVLTATATARPEERQGELATAGAVDEGAVTRLVDRLANRLGEDSVRGLRPVASHVPERAQRLVEPEAPGASWPSLPPRPLRLLVEPEPIEAVAELPDHPPVWFRWRRVPHRVAAAEGPERIAPEWWAPERWAPERWRGQAPVRDYYRLLDTDGARFWVFRAGLYGEDRPAWYLHGLFG